MGSDTFEVLVVGGGPAGMMAAISAAESGKGVCLIEKNEMLGRKLRATGGQFTNKRMGPEFYHPYGGFAWGACKQFGPKELCGFLRGIGMEIDEAGRWDCSADPGEVTDALVKELSRLNVDVRLSMEVTAIEPPRSGEGPFTVRTDKGDHLSAQKVVVAAGGRSYPQLGSDQTGLRFLRETGHAVIPQYAASTWSQRATTHIPAAHTDWREVVVTGGGVSVGEVTPATLESQLAPGLYFAGEALDIHGDRGGYNLQFAFASGRLAGKTEHVDPAFKHLFSPLRIGSLALKNRIVMAAVCTGFEISSPRGREYLRVRAEGGAALIICMGPLGARADLEGLGALVEAVHAGGAKIGIQLTASRQDIQALGGQPVPGSDIINALPEAILKALPMTMAAAAVRAQCVGFDLVEIHGAHSTLVARSASPKFNRRTDSYGGSREKRHRFPTEVAAAVSAAIGPDTLLAYRLNAEEVMEGGASVEDAIALAKAVVACGVKLIDVSKCGQSADGSQGDIMCPSADAPEGTHFGVASAIGKAAGVPVIGVGRVQSPELADQAVERGEVDLVGIARGLLADPGWPRKARTGEVDSIVSCLACNTCLRALYAGEAINCPQNAALGKEA